MAADSEMVSLFKQELALCKVGEGTSLAVLSEGDVRADYAAAFLEAAADLGADAFQVNIRKRPGSFFGPGNSLKGNGSAIAALKGVDMVVDLVGLLWSKEQTEITRAGPRMLLVLEHFEVLRRMLSSPDDRRRVEAGAKMLAGAKEMRITSPGGTDVVYRLGKYNVVEQYGFTDAPGRWDAWPGVFLYTAAHDDGVDGTVVIDKGDMLLPLMRYVNEPIRLTIERGMVTGIAGEGVDAELMRSFMAGFDDPRAYAVSHIGWGLDARARWEFMGTSHAGPHSGGQDGRAYYGNVLFSTGPNTEVGGTNDTLCHLDIPLRGCTLALDDRTIVENGRVVPEELRAAGR